MEGEIEILLGGKKQKLTFSMWAIEKKDEVLAENKRPIAFSTTATTIAIIYAGLANQYRIEKKKEDFTLSSVADWVYELFDSNGGIDFIDTVIQAYNNCQAAKNLKEYNDRQAKKNLQSNGLTSTLSPSENLG